MKARTIFPGLMLLSLICVLAIPARAQTGNADFQQAVAAYQQSPNDANAEKVIRMAAAMDQLPPIPEEARRHFVRGTALFKDAKTMDDYDQVAGEFKQAVHLAPWWPDARYNYALVQEAAGVYDWAIKNLKLYLLFKLSDADARAAQDKIYALEAKQEKAAKAKEEENSPQAVAAREQSDYQTWLRKLDGARFVGQSNWTPDIRYDNELIVRGSTLVWRQCEVWTAPNVVRSSDLGMWKEKSQMPIVGHEAKYYWPSMPNYPVSILTISDDGNSITEKQQVGDGATFRYSRQ